MGIFRKTEKTAAQVLSLPVADIRPNPNQPRHMFSQPELEELAQSIRELGILQPLTVRRGESNDWELVAGERRLRAAILAGLEQVPCLVIEVDDSRSTLLALVENVQRQNLDFREEALALDRLMEVCGLSQAEAARKLGKSQPAIANKLRLLKLPPDVLLALRDGGCTERHARALLRLSDAKMQRDAAAYILRRGLNVAQTEEYVDLLLSPRNKPNKPVYFIRDVRLFMNTVNKGVSIMNAAGIPAQYGKEENESEILLTIHIPK